MNQKIEITKYAMEKHGKIISTESIKRILPKIWQNPRSKDRGGLRLTQEGFKFLTEADLKSYIIKFEDPLGILTNQEIIWLDQQIDSPFYLEKKKIYVFNEKIAVQLALFSGRVLHFAKIKAEKMQST